MPLEFITSITSKLVQPTTSSSSSAANNQMEFASDDTSVMAFQLQPQITLQPASQLIIPLGTLTNIYKIFIQPFLPPTAKVNQPAAAVLVQIDGIGLNQPIKILYQELPADLPCTQIVVTNADPFNPIYLSYLIAGV